MFKHSTNAFSKSKYFKFQKSRIVAAAILTAALLCLPIFSFSDYLSRGGFGIFLLVFSFITILATGLILSVKPTIPHKVSIITSTVLFLLCPVVSITLIEALNNVFVYNMSVSAFMFNYFFYLLFYGLIWAVSGSFKITVIVFNALLYPFALANYFLFDMRGTVFVPSDFSGIATAQNVVSTYVFEITAPIACSAVLLAFIIVLALQLTTPKKSPTERYIRLITRIVCGILFLLLTAVYFFSDFLADNGISPDFWNQNRGYHNTGFFPNFTLNTKYLYYNAPNGYNADEVENIVYKQIVDELAHTKPEIKDSDQTPNIICIMNESLADLKVLGDFTTNQEYMPFISSLKENTIRGNLYVPVNGAGTSNTEFEFLTGCSTSFLPSGSNAYMSYIKNPLPSLVSILTNNNYSTRAIHPYYSSGWNRTNVYNFMGFEAFRSLGSFLPMSIMREYQSSGFDIELLNSLVEERLPGQNALIRQYISDVYNYHSVIADYENSDYTKPYFAFNITMQNHGGYTSHCSNFKEDVFVTSASTDYPKTNSYLSLLKKSDEAFEELVNYFSDVDEPTVICLFGDHQPGIETAFIEEIMGKSVDELSDEESQKRYITPFIIWTNYDIEEQQIERLSVNYLSTLVLKTAGISLSPYQKYLYSLSKTLPVIDNVGYFDASGKHYSYSEKTAYTQLLNDYEKVQYNMVFDYQNRKNALFDYTEPQTSNDNTEE